ncbi:MAG TPA: M14 family metallopeptidase [Cyclobacteriaceae bacterium]|nr:M14 family metallopeptidase [Cyclobacteriaceae bacterium]
MKFLPFYLLLIVGSATAQTYSDHTKVSQRLKTIETANSQTTKLTSLAKTAGGKDIWLLEIGSGDRNNHPGIVVIGGVEGSHLLGTELAVGFAEKLMASANTDSIKTLLANTTFYVLPNVSPDATEQYFAKVKYERSANATATDDDRDGKLNEDPFEDLNNDGQITWIRIEDQTGKWKEHPADPRVMVMANAEKGESGKYNLVQEGTDNDKDGKFNEDGEGGVHFNKSLTFDPPHFTPGAGEHPVSEIENRAVLDYLYERFNVFAVVTFGPTNNLSEPWKFDKTKNAGRIPGAITEPDAKQNKFASDIYKKAVTLKDAPAAGPQKGDFSQWAYFHYGRQSFSTPGWWVPKFEVPKDTVAAKKFKANDDKNTDIDFVRWADKEKVEVFVNWQKISYPDYPNMNAEVGGFKPFVKTNPPFSYVDKLATEHTKFLVAIAAKRPQIELLNLKTEPLDGGVTRVTVTVQNPGLFPAVTDIGKNNNWIKLVKLTLNTTGDQSIVGGKKVTLFPNVEAGESKTVSWLVKGKGKVTIEAGAPQTGIKTLNANL